MKKVKKQSRGLRKAKKLEAQRPLKGVDHTPIVVTKPTDVSNP